MTAAVRATLLLFIAHVALGQGLRRDVTLYQFENATPNSAEARQYATLHYILSQKLVTIEAEAGNLLKPPSGSSFLRLTNPIPLPVAANLLEYQQRTNSLEVITGVIFGADKSYLVTSTVFIGDLHGSLPRPQILLRLPISPEQAGTILDAFSLVTMYALAMDAMQHHAPRPTIIRLLSNARDVQQDVARELDDAHIGGRERADIAALGAAIDTAIKEVQAGRP